MALNRITVDSIAANAVTNVGIANGTIVSVDLADGSVTTTKIDTGSVTGVKLGLTSINANNIVNASITGDKIGVGQITANLFASGAVSTTSISNGNSNVSIASANSDVSIFTAGTEAMLIDSGQRTKFPTTIGVGGATPSTSGSGISFPATQSASTDANTLDDYEEGTWTATLTPDTSGTITVNNATSVNRYTKIGQLVTITATIQVSSVSSPVGRLALGGLPFSQDSSSIGGQCVYNLGLTGSPGGFYQIISGGTTNLYLDIQTADGTNPAINGSNFITTGTSLRFIVFYRIA
jgi:hypothetical protein